ncbi:MAG TPA: TIGR03621 family F420-dependent LLM class oxidoreductase [Actinomycetota bacterium]|nr:TIGR03621 family F420-dependent LLM class oxidoreductase [Actinomycetota bacterium]
MSPRPFRFGVQLRASGTRSDWVDSVRRAEDLGYETVFMPDHFGDQFAPIPALMAAADCSGMRIGMAVLDNDYRHPVVLAKEAATLDVLSDGRLELGIGAGWMRTDYEQSGIRYDPPAVRVDRFEEGLKVLKGLFADGPFSFRGKHYAVSELDGRPKPVQRPHPPIFVGGGGRRVLGIAAREADIVGINFDLRGGEVNAELGTQATPDVVNRKIGWIRDAAGERFDSLELNNLVYMAQVTDDRPGVAAMLAPAFGLSPEQALEVPFALVGTTDEIADDLRARREAYGISYVVMPEDAYVALGPVVKALAGT